MVHMSASDRETASPNGRPNWKTRTVADDSAITAMQIATNMVPVRPMVFESSNANQKLLVNHALRTMRGRIYNRLALWNP